MIQLANRIALKIAYEMKLVRVLGYTGSYLLSGGVKTRIHLNHFLSPLFPEMTESLYFNIDFFDPAGKKITSIQRELVKFSGSIVEVEKELAGFDASYGMFLVSILASKKTSKLLYSNGISVLASYFFISWEFPDGSISCSHSIEAFRGKYFGVPFLLEPLIRPDKISDHRVWTSNKYIKPKNLEFCELLFCNSTNDKKIMSVAIKQGERPLASYNFSIGSRGSNILRFDASAKTNELETITVEVDGLIGNAKPYGFFKYKDRNLYAHHM